MQLSHSHSLTILSNSPKAFKSTNFRSILFISDVNISPIQPLQNRPQCSSTFRLSSKIITRFLYFCHCGCAVEEIQPCQNFYPDYQMRPFASSACDTKLCCLWLNVRSQAAMLSRVRELHLSAIRGAQSNSEIWFRPFTLPCSQPFPTHHWSCTKARGPFCRY